MLPLPGHAVPLALINATIDKKVDEYKANTSKSAQTDIADVVAAAMPKADPVALAKGLILQAELLEADAAAKREEAYTLDPESRPSRGRPALPVDIKAQKLEEQKEKRRERERAKAASAKIEKVESALDARVAAKIKRDASRTTPVVTK